MPPHVSSSTRRSAAPSIAGPKTRASPAALSASLAAAQVGEYLGVPGSIAPSAIASQLPMGKPSRPGSAAAAAKRAIAYAPGQREPSPLASTSLPPLHAPSMLTTLHTEDVAGHPPSVTELDEEKSPVGNEAAAPTEAASEASADGTAADADTEAAPPTAMQETGTASTELAATAAASAPSAVAPAPVPAPVLPAPPATPVRSSAPASTGFWSELVSGSIGRALGIQVSGALAEETGGATGSAAPSTPSAQRTSVFSLFSPPAANAASSAATPTAAPASTSHTRSSSFTGVLQSLSGLATMAAYSGEYATTEEVSAALRDITGLEESSGASDDEAAEVEMALEAAKASASAAAEDPIQKQDSSKSTIDSSESSGSIGTQSSARTPVTPPPLPPVPAPAPAPQDLGRTPPAYLPPGMLARFPRLTIDAARESCPECNHVLSFADIRKGWTSSEHDYTTACPYCAPPPAASGSGAAASTAAKGVNASALSRRRRFVARFSVTCEASDWRGSSSLGPNAILFVEFLPYPVLLKELQSTLSSTTLFGPHLHRRAPVVFFNLLLDFVDSQLPTDFLEHLCEKLPPGAELGQQPSSSGQRERRSSASSLSATTTTRAASSSPVSVSSPISSAPTVTTAPQSNVAEAVIV